MNDRHLRIINRHILESATAVFVDLENGSYRCYKARLTGAIKDGIYSADFVKHYAKHVPNVIIAKEAHVS